MKTIEEEQEELARAVDSFKKIVEIIIYFFLGCGTIYIAVEIFKGGKW